MTLKISESHSVWTSLESTVSDVRKGITKCRMLTGTYLLELSKRKFNMSTVSATCKCCGIADEDLPHMPLECSALISQRKLFYPRIKTLTIDCIGLSQWKEKFASRENLVKLILDCTVYPEIAEKKQCKEIL